MSTMRKWLGLAISIILSIWMLIPLFGSGYFPMHDDTQVARVVVMGRALREGQFPVRWVSDLGYGYGYPIFNFYSPLPYYVGGSLYALGVDSVVATKIMFGAGIILASVFSYLLLVSVFGVLAGLVGSTLFVYTPYHAIQIYVRGSVGEYWAIAFVPLFLWGLLTIYRHGLHARGFIGGSLGFAGVLLSHTILGFVTCMYTIVGLLMYAIISQVRKFKYVHSLRDLIIPVIAGLGLSAFFWLPAIVEVHYTGVSAMITSASTGFFDHFVCPWQLWNSPWGFGGSAIGCANDGMSLKLGKYQLILFLLGSGYWYIAGRKKYNKGITGLMIISIVCFFVSVFGMLDVSALFWRLVPYVTYIQYPWRLLSFTALAMGVGGCYVLFLPKTKIQRYILAIVLVVSCVVINAKLFRPQYIYPRDSKAFESNDDIRYRVSKISDEYLPPGIIVPTDPKEVVFPLVENTDILTVKTIKYTDTVNQIHFDSSEKQRIIIRKAYFPGWKYWLDGKEVTPQIQSGLPSIEIPEGQFNLEMRFTNTPVRLWANWISLIFLCIVTGTLLYDKKNIT
jgi:hypothetical protein